MSKMEENFTGVYYSSMLSQISQSLRPYRYLEVGVRDGANLAGIHCSNAIGVDPAFCIRHNVAANKTIGVELYAMTSDAFFSRGENYVKSRGLVDLAFLDGLHQWEFLLRDFYNTEANSKSNATIFLHDCIPGNREMTERKHNPNDRKDKTKASWWTGDVWKLLPVLAEFRKDLRVTYFDCPPTGLVAVNKLNPASNELKARYYEIVEFVNNLESRADCLEAFLQEIKIHKSDMILAQADKLSLIFQPS